MGSEWLGSVVWGIAWYGKAKGRGCVGFGAVRFSGVWLKGSVESGAAWWG